MPLIKKTIDKTQNMTIAKIDGHMVDYHIHFYHRLDHCLPKARLDAVFYHFDGFRLELAHLAKHSGFTAWDGTIDHATPRDPAEFAEMALCIADRYGVVDVQYLIDRLQLLIALTREINAIILYDDVGMPGHRAKLAIDALFDVDLVMGFLKEAQDRVFRSVRTIYGFEHLPIDEEA